MKSKIAGVALAAVVGACALGGQAQRVEAAPIGFTLPLTVYTIDGMGGNQEDIATIYYVQGRLDLSHIELNYYNLGSLVYHYTSVGLDTFYHYYDPGTVDLPYATETIIATSPGGGVGYSEYPMLNFDSVFYGEGGGSFETPLLTVYTDTVSYVPLPASAPLLGSALFILGCAAYARRHGKALPA